MSSGAAIWPLTPSYFLPPLILIHTTFLRGFRKNILEPEKSVGQPKNLRSKIDIVIFRPDNFYFVQNFTLITNIKTKILDNVPFKSYTGSKVAEIDFLAFSHANKNLIKIAGREI